MSAEEALSSGPLARMHANGAYWLRFQGVDLPPEVLACESPLRELAIGTVLRFGDPLDPELTPDMVTQVAAELAGQAKAPPAVLRQLERFADALASVSTWLERGFAWRASNASASGYMVRAGGRHDATWEIDGQALGEEAPAGCTIDVRVVAPGTGRVPAPDIHNERGAQHLWRRTSADHQQVVLCIPGRYLLALPGQPARTLDVR